MSTAFTEYQEARHDIYELENLGIVLKGKKILDIGAGRGTHTSILRKEGADVYSFEPDGRRRFNAEYIKGKTYFEYIQDLPKELHGFFDVALYYRFMAQASSIEFAARALNQKGILVSTFHEGQIGSFPDNKSTSFQLGDSDEAKALQKFFKKTKFINLGHSSGFWIKCIASEPVIEAQK